MPIPPNPNPNKKGAVPLWTKPHTAAQVARIGQAAATPASPQASPPNKMVLQTGGDDRQREAEARKLIAMVDPVWDRLDYPECLTGKDIEFLADMSDKVARIPLGLYVSGRQLFWLRDIKDRLVGAGLV